MDDEPTLAELLSKVGEMINEGGFTVEEWALIRASLAEAIDATKKAEAALAE